MKTLPADDIDRAVALARPLWDDLRGRRVFVTGGTGFFGRWAIETFLAANARFDLGSMAVVLTRDIAATRASAPRLATDPAIELVEGDVRTFAFPSGAFHAVMHMATDASVGLIDAQPLGMLDAIVDGTRRTLEFARERGANRFLNASSGAVYGRQPRDLPLMPEDYGGAPDVAGPRASYAEGKRLAELLGHLYHQQFGLEVVNARFFAFLGPLLQLDRGYAVGNFMADALAGRAIRLSGDGSPIRSYLYASDLAAWIWTLLLRGGAGRTYNVGSEETVSVADAARIVAASFDPPPAVEIAGTADPTRPPDRYVPSTARARVELGLTATVPFAEQVRRTVRWLREESPA